VMFEKSCVSVGVNALIVTKTKSGVGCGEGGVWDGESSDEE
jgi:hypothetical protein